MTRHELPPLNALRAFEAVARLNSVTRAGAELSVTHGAVSRQLRLLEASLGKPLFARQGRGLVLTAAGEQLHEGASAALGALRDSWAALRQNRTPDAFVLGCPGSLLARWVIPRLDRLGHDLPTLQLHLSAQEEPLSPDLAGMDGALLLAARPWPPNWRVEVLAPERIGPVVSPRYAGWPRLRGLPASVLLDEPVLHTASRPQAWSDWATATGLAVAPAARGQGFAHLYYLLEAAVAGLGVAIAPAPLVADDLDSGRLLAPWGFQPTAAEWIFATPKGRRDERADGMAAWLRAELADA
ncbi:MAG: LysR family transcriptional regulator [Rhodanobacter sp.]|nr:MAG: LysR family transcriptional regulator [Rhodanobacter sp.]